MSDFGEEDLQRVCEFYEDCEPVKKAGVSTADVVKEWRMLKKVLLKR